MSIPARFERHQSTDELAVDVLTDFVGRTALEQYPANPAFVLRTRPRQIVREALLHPLLWPKFLEVAQGQNTPERHRALIEWAGRTMRDKRLLERIQFGALVHVEKMKDF